MEDRFSLLYLEPGEIYFIDVAVNFCKDPDSKERIKHPVSSQTKTTSTIRSKERKTPTGLISESLFDWHKLYVVLEGNSVMFNMTRLISITFTYLLLLLINRI